MDNKREKFLEFLVSILNRAFDDESFSIVDDEIIDIYSSRNGVAVISLVSDPTKEEELSTVELFRVMDRILDKLPRLGKFRINRLVIVSTNNEDELITKFLEFQAGKRNLDFEVEFWGWESIAELVESYNYSFEDEVPEDVDFLVNKVPSANIYQLFGIEETLSEIDEKLDSSINPVVLYNPVPGSGKTTNALAYAFHYDYQKKFDHIAYVQVVDNLKLDFVLAFEGRLGFKFRTDFSLNENFEILLEKLNNLKGRNLLIIDGLHKANHASVCLAIAQMLKWKILITSKFKVYTFENLYLNFPSPANAAKIFNYYAKTNDESLVDEIVKQVGYHPFAIVFLAKSYSYLKISQDISLEEFWNYLQQKRNKVYHINGYIDRSLDGELVNLQQVVMKYMLAVYDLQAKEFSNLEKRIMLILSVLPKDEVSFRQLRQFVPYGKEEDFNDAILLMLSRGWLEADKGNFRIPSFSAMVLHKRLKPAPNKLKRFFRILDEGISQSLPGALFYVEMIKSFINSVTTITEDLATLAYKLAVVCEFTGCEKEAAEYFEFAVYIYEDIASQVSDPDLFELIARIWIKLEDYERALYYALELLNILQESGEEGEKLAEAYLLLSRLYAVIYDYEKAIYYADSALELFTGLWDENDSRLQEIREYYKALKEEVENNNQKQNKRQWFRRLFS